MYMYARDDTHIIHRHIREIREKPKMPMNVNLLYMYISTYMFIKMGASLYYMFMYYVPAFW